LKKFRAAETGLPQDRAKRTRRKIMSMDGHYRLTVGIASVPQEMMRALGPNHVEPGTLQSRDNCAARQGR
jgi:hypothetical protein